MKLCFSTVRVSFCLNQARESDIFKTWIGSHGTFLFFFKVHMGIIDLTENSELEKNCALLQSWNKYNYGKEKGLKISMDNEDFAYWTLLAISRGFRFMKSPSMQYTLKKPQHGTVVETRATQTAIGLQLGHMCWSKSSAASITNATRLLQVLLFHLQMGHPC